MANDWTFIREGDGTVTAQSESGSCEMPDEIAKIDGVHRVANGLNRIAGAISDVAMAIEALASAQGGRPPQN